MATTTPAAPAPVSAVDLISLSKKIEIKVGRMLSVTRHPDAERLFVECVDLGEEEPRTVLSGLVGLFTEQQLQGRLYCFVSNLKPANMRGIQSQAMVLVAKSGETL